MQINKVILLGHAGKDPDVHYLENNVPVAKFPLATSETYKNKNGERVSTTEWHNIVLWRSLAEVADKFIRKGTEVYIEGKLRTRSWEDKEGHKRFITEVVGNTLVLGKRIPKEQTVGQRRAEQLNGTEDLTGDLDADISLHFTSDDDNLSF